MSAVLRLRHLGGGRGRSPEASATPPQDQPSAALARRPECIFVNPFERGEIGPDLFRARMGVEGLVSKHRDRPYQAGRSKH
jgi:hypothetical protein